MCVYAQSRKRKQTLDVARQRGAGTRPSIQWGSFLFLKSLKVGSLSCLPTNSMQVFVGFCSAVGSPFMMDPNVFVSIYTKGDNHNAIKAFESQENKHFYVGSAAYTDDRGSRGPTPCVFPDTESPIASSRNGTRLELRFNSSSSLKDPSEDWQFGYSSRDLDVVIFCPGTVAVSRSLSITPDFRIQFRQMTKQPTELFLCLKSGHR